MPTPGLALIGFLDHPQALNLLRTACVPADPSDAALLSEWAAARGKLGTPVPNAGKPDIAELPDASKPHIAKVKQTWGHALSGPHLASATFKLVEIEPLLAFQFMIDSERSDHHCNKLPKNGKPEDHLEVCLPSAMPNEPIAISQQATSVILKSRCLNVRVTAQGVFQQHSAAGIVFGLSLPLVHVVRHNGRCYLHNGFHRALGVKLSGASHVPCLFRDVASHEEVGIRPDGSTFSLQLLESSNPPTVGHYTQGRACSVSMRAMERIIHVTWSDHVMPME